MNKCIKCGKEIFNYLCDECRESVDIKLLCKKIINDYKKHKINDSNEYLFCNNDMSSENFNNIIDELTSYMGVPYLEFYKILSILSKYYTVSRENRDYLINNSSVCLNSDLFDDSSKNMIRIALLEAYYRNYMFDESEKISNELILKNGLDFMMLYSLGYYYMITRRYDSALKFFYGAKLLNSDVNFFDIIEEKISECLSRKHKIKPEYLPRTIEGKNSYKSFIMKLGMEFNDNVSENNDDVESLVTDIIEDDNISCLEESVFVLEKYGLSKKICGNLNDKKVVLTDIINSNFKDAYSIGDSTYIKIVRAYFGYLLENDVACFENLFKDKSIFLLADYGVSSGLIKSFADKSITLRDIVFDAENFNCIISPGKIQNDIIIATLKVLLGEKNSDSIQVFDFQGLAKSIVEMAYKNNISLDELDNDSVSCLARIKEMDDEYLERVFEEKSIFLLLEYNISVDYVKKLYDNSITFRDILLGTEKFNDLFDAGKKKNDIILTSLKILLVEEKNKSIYVLLVYGLTKRIIDILFEKKILLSDVNRDILLSKYNISISTCNKIMNAYNLYLENNRFTFDMTEDILLGIIKDKFSHNGFNYTELKDVLINDGYSVDNLDVLVKGLVVSKLLSAHGEYFEVLYPQLIDEINKLSNNNNRRDIVLKKLSGMTLESIGDEYNLTRERIRQIFIKQLKNISKVREDEYREIFETYDIPASLFCNMFNVEKYVYYYLKEKYKIGEKPYEELIGSPELTLAQQEIVAAECKLIDYYGEFIPAYKKNLLVAILKRLNGIAKYDQIVNEYNKFLLENNISYLDEIKIDDEFRSVDSIFGRSDYVISRGGGYYRYYDLTVIKDEEIDELKSLFDLSPGDYSTEYFLANNKVLIEKFDIDDCNELHNFLRKVVGDCEGRINYSRMPHILVECKDKWEFVLDQMMLLAPISLDDFVDYICQNFGWGENTFRAFMFPSFSEYITNGIINMESNTFSDEQYLIMKERLVDDIYSIDTIKRLLTDLFDVNDFKLINNMNMMKLGYKVRPNYIMKSNIPSLEPYLKNKILEEDYYLIPKELTKIGSTFTSYLYRFIYNKDIFKIDENKYITITKLNKMGITKEMITKLVEKVEEKVIQDEYFNYYSFDKMGLFDEFKVYEFSQYFFESILLLVPDVKSFTIKNHTIFIKTKEAVSRESFINSFIVKNKTFVSEISKIILDKFNVNLSNGYIKQFINRKKFYFHEGSECVYLNRDIYEDEVNQWDILQFIN